MKKFTAILLTFFLVQGQPLEQIKKDIFVLASDSLEGRGYVNEAHKRAAQYLFNRLASMEYVPYYQFFETTINVIYDATLCIQEHCFTIGKAFLPASFSGKGKIQTTLIDIKDGLPKHYAKKNVLGKCVLMNAEVSERYKKKYSSNLLQLSVRILYAIKQGASAILLRTNKLTHDLAPLAYPIPVLWVLEDSLPPIKKHSEVFIEVESEVKKEVLRNVFVIKEGEVDSAIIVCAHYDHLGRIGKAIFNGANDNASGVALLLALADTFQYIPTRYAIVFIAFGGEELGLLGAYAYLKDPAFPLNKTRFVLNLDLWGYGEKGFMAVGGKDFPEYYHLLKAIVDSCCAEEFPLYARPNAPNSDHYPFTQRGIPALFLYAMGGNPYYHDVWDRPEVLSLRGIPYIYKILIAFLQRLSQ